MRRVLVIGLIISVVTFKLFSITAIDTEGRSIILNEDGTWTVKTINTDTLVKVPSEKDLYSMIKYDYDSAMLKLYLDSYEGVDLKNTISVIYHYCFNKPYNEEFNIWRLKGIAYSEKLGKTFMITIGPYNIDFISNLSFYWDFAMSMERNGNIAEALKYYELLRSSIIETDGKYIYSVLDSSLDQVDAKIFKMKLFLQGT